MTNSLEKLQVYSSEEQLIGTWFDKPLYRKCYEVTNVNIRDAIIPHNIENLGEIIKIEGVFAIDNYSQYHTLSIIDQSTSTNRNYGCGVCYYKNENKLKTIGLWGDSGTNRNVDKIMFELLYTKTTD